MITRLLAALSLTLSFLYFAPPAQAAACEPGQGVTVVVQTPEWKRTGCASGEPETGLKALEAAGFHPQFVPNQDGAVCLIDGYPADRKCWQPPKYWSYWHAKPGGDWVYSSSGSGNRKPVAGGTEGWRFGGKIAPDFTPVATPAPPKKSQPKPKNPDQKSRPGKPQPGDKGKEPTPSKPGKSANNTPPGADAPKSTNNAGDAEPPSVEPGQDQGDKQHNKQQKKKAQKAKAANKKAAADSGQQTSTESTNDAPSSASDEAVSSADLVGASATVDDDGGLSWPVAMGLIAVVGAVGAGVGLRRRRG